MSQSHQADPEAPAWAVNLQADTVDKLKDYFKDEIVKATAQIQANITSLLKPIEDENISLRKVTNELTNKVTVQQGLIDYMRTNTGETRSRLIRLEAYSMRENLIITGLDEVKGETEDILYDSLIKLFSGDMAVDMSNIQIVRCHRLSRGVKRAGPRDVIARFATLTGKKKVLYSGYRLKGRTSPIFINEQFPREVEQQRRILRPIQRKCKELNKKCTLVQDKLIIEGKSYTVNNICDIPFDTTGLATQITSTHIMFNGRLSEYSNFYTRDGLFNVDDGNSYTSTEQYYQYSRAVI